MSKRLRIIAIHIFVLSLMTSGCGSKQPKSLAPIAAGDFYSCMLTSAGGVKCWGKNSVGQLGDGTTTQRSTPTDVTGLTSGVNAVVAGWKHTCALTLNGGVKCWGDNSYGQLGDGTTINRTTPIDVDGLESGIKAITAGGYHTCALTLDGKVKCWGYNDGELGDGSTIHRYTPVDVKGLDLEIIVISAGWGHTCALTSSGGVKCWGYNNSALGDGTTTKRTTPIDVVGLESGIKNIAAGNYYTCALTSGGGVKCWGIISQSGQLSSNMETAYSLMPIDIVGLTNGVSAIAAGGDHTCVLTSSGMVKCWGLNSHAQMGDGTTTQKHAPADVSGFTGDVIAITAGISHTCALISDGTIKCWGSNLFGELGDGTTIERLTPVDVVYQ